MTRELLGEEAAAWIETSLKNIQRQYMRITFALMTTTHATDYHVQYAHRSVLTYDIKNRRPVLTVED